MQHAVTVLIHVVRKNYIHTQFRCNHCNYNYYDSYSSVHLHYSRVLLLITECKVGVVSFLPKKIDAWKIRCPITMTTRTFNGDSI